MRPFLDSGATFLYFPVEWLLQKAVADLRAEMGL
jgi:hypothetical protein